MNDMKKLNMKLVNQMESPDECSKGTKKAIESIKFGKKIE
jgi:hypothetical protein